MNIKPNPMTAIEMVAHLRKWMTVEEFVRLFDLIGDDNADGPFFDAMADEMETLFPENPSQVKIT